MLFKELWPFNLPCVVSFKCSSILYYARTHTNTHTHAPTHSLTHTPFPHTLIPHIHTHIIYLSVLAFAGCDTHSIHQTTFRHMWRFDVKYSPEFSQHGLFWGLIVCLFLRLFVCLVVCSFNVVCLSCLVVCLLVCLFSWLVGWLFVCSVGCCFVCWFVCLFSFLVCVGLLR